MRVDQSMYYNVRPELSTFGPLRNRYSSIFPMTTRPELILQSPNPRQLNVSCVTDTPHSRSIQTSSEEKDGMKFF